MTELRNEVEAIELPAYPLLSAFSCEDLRFEMGSYWEGALYFICKILGESTPRAGLRAIEFAQVNEWYSLEEFLFLEIWNSHGQLKWLKAHLVREEKQDLLGYEEDLRTVANRLADEDLIWLAHFVEQHKDEGTKFPNPYFGGTNPLHLGLILEGSEER
ncbi:MAG: hypothetical protein JJU29_19235 [Verrucomicrobia bacterium]|nr:hypothetical protein [Verrucomicrobiota bacterium]